MYHRNMSERSKEVGLFLKVSEDVVTISKDPLKFTGPSHRMFFTKHNVITSAFPLFKIGKLGGCTVIYMDVCVVALVKVL